MPTDMHQLPREEFIERNLGLVHACAGSKKLCCSPLKQ